MLIAKEIKINYTYVIMKYKNILWGIVLIGIGILFILKNMGMIHFHWLAIFQLWPLLLVLWGISMIPVKDYIKLILSVVSIIAALIIISYNHSNVYIGWSCKNNKQFKQQNINETYDSTITKATLELDAAAGNIDIIEATDKLIDFDNKGSIGNYKINTSVKDSSKIIKLELEDNVININSSTEGNNALIKLNKNPVWNVNIDAGAANLNLDLSMFKIASVKINGGASKVRIKLGTLSNNIKLDVEAGASSINILFPKESGCEVKSDNVLSSKQMPDFKEIKEDIYQTDSFIIKPNKIFVSIDAAVSKINIQKY